MSWQLTETDRAAIRLALEEDLGSTLRDLTTDTLLSEKMPAAVAEVYTKEKTPIVTCGSPAVQAVFQALEPSARVETVVAEGKPASTGSTLLRIYASPQALLKGERTALNFIRHLSAVATLTRAFVDAVKNTPMQILDTRKTTPGLRHLEKCAVVCGGGVNHRQGLFDAVLIKNNHVDLCGGMEKALARLPRDLCRQVTVVVEVRSIGELESVLQHGKDKVSRVLLDNLSLQDLQTGVAKCRGIFETEASGNVTLQTVQEIAATGVDFASVGRLTYAAGNVDLSMRILP